MYVLQSQANLAWVAWREGDVARAERLARAAWTDWDSAGPLGVLGWAVLWPLVGAAVASGRVDAAVAYACAMLEPARRPLADDVSAALERAAAAGDADAALAE